MRTNISVSDNESTYPILCSLRVALWETLGYPSRAATLRWRRINSRRPRKCECGASGTVQVVSDYPVVGSCQPYWWRCAEHGDIPLTVPWSGGVPLIDQSPDQCSWSRSRSATGIIVECGCGTHVGLTKEG